MSIIGRRMTAVTGALALAALAGCDSKDATGPGESLTLQNQDDILSVALGTTDLVSALLGDVGPLTEADFSTLDLGLSGGTALRAGEEIEWIEQEQAWGLDAEEVDSSPDGDVTMDVHVRIQYLTAAGVPQELPDELTESVTLALDIATTLHGEQEGSVFDLGLDYSFDVSIAGLPDGPHPVDGEGAMLASMYWSEPGQPAVDFDVSMDWLLAVIVPAEEGCPDGLVSVSVDDGETAEVTFVATYDGTNEMDWALFRSGQPLERGTQPLACTVSAL